MKTQFVKFIKNSVAFSHEMGEVAELQDADAKRAIDMGLAVASTKPSEKAVESGAAAEKAVIENISEKAVDATAKQRAEAHGIHDKTRTVGTPVGPAENPVATEPDGNLILVKPEDEKLAADQKEAKK